MFKVRPCSFEVPPAVKTIWPATMQSTCMQPSPCHRHVALW
jgi:hypothetical protein